MRSSSFSFDVQEDFCKLVGNLGDRFMYQVLLGSLPGFDGTCWTSGSRTSVGLPPLNGAEPPYDFVFNDKQGLLSGKPGTRCYIECKATSSSVAEAAAAGSSPKPMEISGNEWQLARHLHDHPEEGMFLVARVDRVTHPQGPRLVSVLRDPVQLMKEGRLWVMGERLQLCDYPVV